MPVRDSAQGVSGPDGERERAADAVRSLSRSFLLTAALGGVVIPLIGVPLGVVALIGAFQRLMALRALESTEMGRRLIPADWSRRVRAGAITELCAGGVAVILSLVGVSAVVAIAADGLWFGAGAISAVAGGMGLRAALARAAATAEVVDPGRGIVPMLSGLGAVALGVAASSVGASLPGVSELAALLMLAGVGAWAIGAIMVAFAGSALAGEVSLPSKAARHLLDGRGDAAPTEITASVPVVRAAAPPPDDDPIPY